MRKIYYFTLVASLLLSVAGVQAQTGGGNAGAGGNPAAGGGGGGNGGKAPKAATASGTVIKVSAGEFMIVDTSGAPITIPISNATTFLLNKTPGAFQDVVRPGMKIKATSAPDGTAAQVTASGLATSLNINQLQAFLGATNEEWAILKPHINRIKALKNELSNNGGNGGNGGGNSGNNGNTPAAPPAPTALEVASQTLTDAAFSDAPQQSLAVALKNERDIKAKLSMDLAAEKTALINLLTARQEALLVAIGLVD